MKTFTYTITDALGIHARPAGLLAREAKGFPDTVTVTAEGGSEEAACAAMEAFFKAHL